MDHDFDQNLGQTGERRSRKNPRARDAALEREQWENRIREGQKRNTDSLKVFEDSSVYPIPKAEPRTSAPLPGGRTASRQTAAAGSSRNALPSGMEEQIAKRKRRKRMIAMIVAECFALLFIFSYAYFMKQWNKIQRPVVEVENVKNNDLGMDALEKMEGYWTIAIFGVDARDRAIANGTNADVNMICNINRDTGEIRLVSVFRDTYLNISENGSYNKINQAYFSGGPEQALAAFNRNMDLNITEYMTFNWKAVADAINILGGVDIELSKAEFYYINSFITETVKVTGIGSNHLKKAGMNHLDGVQAVAYGRLRLMDTDFARTERQRKIIMQAFEKAKKADFNTLNTLIGAVFPNIATNIGVDDVVRNAKNIARYHIGETTGFPQARGDANMGKKGAVVVPQTLEGNVIQLHKFLFGDEIYSPSGTVKRISAKIAADSGLYKEGKYIDRVDTDGGVIQPPKTSKSETKKSTEEDEEEDNLKETDQYGRPVESTSSSRPGILPTSPETDEDGNPLESTTSSRPGQTTESTGQVRPGQTTEPTTAARPGQTTEPTTASRPGQTTPPTTASRPGQSTEPTTAPRPGQTTEPTTSSRPGQTTSPTTAAPVHPGQTTEPTTTARPGGGSSPGQTEGSNGPGSAGPGGEAPGNTPDNPVIIGTVAAPGQ